MGHFSPEPSLQRCCPLAAGFSVLNSAAAKGRFCGKWGRTAPGLSSARAGAVGELQEGWLRAASVRNSPPKWKERAELLLPQGRKCSPVHPGELEGGFCGGDSTQWAASLGQGARQGWRRDQAPCVPQVERGTEIRSLGKVRYPPVVFSGVGGTIPGRCREAPNAWWGASVCVVFWHTGGHLTMYLCWRKIYLGERGGLAQFCGVLGRGVKANASVPLTLSFSPVPGDPQVNQSPNPSKCWCIFSGARSELGAVPPCDGLGATG